jgi:hypothetical protein
MRTLARPAVGTAHGVVDALVAEAPHQIRNAASGCDVDTHTTRRSEHMHARLTPRLRRAVALTVLAAAATWVSAPPALAAKKKTTHAKKKTTKRAATKTTKKVTATTAVAAPASSGRQIPDHPVQGITASEIKVGFVLGPNVSATSDYRATYQGLLQMYRDQGKLPANGRDIKPVWFQESSGNSAADLAASQRQACVQLASKDKVAIAMGHSNITPTATCMAQEYRIPFLLQGGVIPTDDDLKAQYPFLFIGNMSSSRELRNWPYWAKDQGFLSAGSKIAYFNTDDPVEIADFNKNFKPEFSKLGYKFSAEALYRDASSIPTTVQRFKSTGIDVVFLGAGLQMVALAQEFDKQSYHPDVLMSDWDNTGILASTPRDAPDNFRATAMSYSHRAEDGLTSNPPEAASATACANDVAKYTGRRLVPYSAGRPTADYAEYQQFFHMCDLMQTLVDALGRAPRSLDTASLITAIEQTKDIDHGLVGHISYSAQSHDGSQTLKTVTWDYNCDCWKHLSGFRPAYVA